MKIQDHDKKISDYLHSLKVLERDGIEKNQELIVQGCVLCSAEAINRELHEQGIRTEDKPDLKHNVLFGFLKDVEGWEEIARIHNDIEDMKYKVVHGKRNGEYTKKSLELLKTLLDKLEIKHE